MRRVLTLAAVVMLAACSSDATGPAQQPGASRSDPAPIGTAVETHIQNQTIWGNGTVRLTVLQVVRGAEANAQVEAWNTYNNAPPAGQEYLLARVRAEVVTNDEPSTAIDLNALRFAVVSGAGVVLEAPLFVAGVEPDLSGELYSGTREGWLPVLVQVGDAQPLLVFDRGEPHARWLRLY